ncbi:MAG: hypothetical protein IJT49_04145 [Clostridia bacterium]|nr:hypothetical protein [Clostridia bacterium]
MKKALKSIVVLLLVASMVYIPLTVTPASAASATPQAYVTSRFNHIVKVSYDEVLYSTSANGSNERQYITCGGSKEKIDTPHLPSGAHCAIFWGWLTADGSDIESFSYVQEGKPAWSMSLSQFKLAAEPAVLGNAKGEFTYRFKIPVEVDDNGITTVQLFANFADGSKEEFWRAKVYVPEYDESAYEDPLTIEMKNGDANEDYWVDNKDVVTLFRYVSGCDLTVNKELADFNKDNKLNNKDVILLFRFISGLIKDPFADDSNWREVKMYDEKLDSSKTPVQLAADGRITQHFSIKSRFDRISVSCPSWSDNVGNIRISLYKYEVSVNESLSHAVIATKLFKNFDDNSWLTLSFAAQEPGDYLVLFSDATENKVGVWLYPSDVSLSVFANNGVATDGEIAMKIHVYGKDSPLFNQAVEGTGGVAPPEPDDSPAVKERDAMPDTWAATDGLGRVLPTNTETGDPKQDKYVGMFYWTWHVEHHTERYDPINLQKICDQYPEAITDHNHSVWNSIANNHACFWNEPIYGYYTTTDKWVLRKQAELLADAGVDVVIFDNTNGTFTWRGSYLALLDTYKKAREDGVKTPKVSFILPFGNAGYAATQLREIYQLAYNDSGYNELWFYWNGKPLMMSLTDGLDRSKELDNEIYKFFTFRPGVPQYNASSQTNTDKWGWLAVYPQAVYTDKNGLKQTTVGVAQNWNGSLVAMNANNVYGRTHTSKGNDTRENAKLYGANFAEQWEYALKKDVNFVFVTGWNEWVAEKQPEWQGTKNAFPDEFNDEFSRDLEPSTGDLKDHYYYQLVSYIRKYKGTRAIPEPTAAKTIDINGNVSQWDNVGPYYIAYKGNTFDRDSDGYKTTHYTNTTGRNDITGAKVARDDSYLYFMAECADNITSYTDKAWMRLFIDTGDSNKNWEGFEYVLNRVSPSSTEATLEKSTGGWNFSTVGKVSYKVNGKYLLVKIPKSYLGISGDTFTVNFKWNDNMQKDGDIMDVYNNGDTAPGGRFMYSYVVK